MIPLAQYFAESGSDEFKPLRNTPVRKPAAPMQRPADALPKAVATPAGMRPLKSVGARPAFTGSEASAPMRAFTEARVPLREVEAERSAWRAEREALEQDMRQAVEAARREGEAAGRKAARDAMQAEFETRIEDRIEAVRSELTEEHQTHLSTSRATWTSEQGDRLADLMILQIAILEETIKVSLNNVLRPLALEARQRQTLDDIVGAVRTITLDGKAFKIAASGPVDLLAALELRLGDKACLMSFEPDETRAEIRIDADSTVIETRLSSWHQALEEALS